MAKTKDSPGTDLVDVRQAAALVGRNPETVRRWIWSGKLSATREGKRFLVERKDLGSLAGGKATVDLSEWARRAGELRRKRSGGRPGRSAADLVIEDRAARAERT